MSDMMIRVKNLGKKYIIGHQAEGHSNDIALRDILAHGKPRWDKFGDELRGDLGKFKIG